MELTAISFSVLVTADWAVIPSHRVPYQYFKLLCAVFWVWVKVIGCMHFDV